MKLKLWLTGWLLSFCITFGTLSALVTAFELYDVSLPGLAFFCLALCALCSFAFLAKRGPVFLFSALGTLLLCSLLWQGLWKSLQSVGYDLSTYYDAAYGWGELSVSDESRLFSQIPAIYFLGTLPALLISWAVCRQKKLLLPLSIALLPMYPCFVVIDTIPESWCFLLVLGASLILVLTQNLRQFDHKAGLRITAFALIPAILLSIFLIVTVPEDGYWFKFPHLESLFQAESPSGNGVLTTPQTFLGMVADNRSDLTQAGPLTGSSRTVLKVRSGFGGFLYLRYQSFDTYSGTQWSCSGLQEESAFWPEEAELDHLGSVSITATTAYDGIFIPYYAKDGSYLLLENGKLPNAEGSKEYRFSVGTLPKTGNSSFVPDFSPYLALPNDTREAALEILQENHLETPEDILEYVKNSAEYSLQTETMPEGETDFALWFLESSESGYCVHFATAAAVLLRAAGYPARYVVGYALSTKRGIPATVTEDRAHAWVEYIDSESSAFWQILEATPGDFAQDPTPEPSTETPQPSTEATQPQTQTQPPTDPSTQPSTLPSQSSLPSETTSPLEMTTGSAATRPTQGSEPQASEKTPLVMSWLWPWLVRLGSLLALVIALWLQYRIRYRLRQKKLRTGTPNRQALNRWQEILLLSRLLKTVPPENLLELAEKARFSQHTVSKEELFQLGQYLQLQRKALQKRSLWKRLCLKLIWAI